MRTVHYENCENASSDECKCGWCAGTRHGWQGAAGIARNPDPRPYRDLYEKTDREWKIEYEKYQKKSSGKVTIKLKTAAIRTLKASFIGGLRDQRFPAEKQLTASFVDHDNVEHLTLSRSDKAESDETNKPPSATVGQSSQSAIGNDARADFSKCPNLICQIESVGTSIFSGVEKTATKNEKPAIKSTGIMNKIEREYGKKLSIDTRRAMADHFWCDLLAHLAYLLDGGIKMVENIPDRLTRAIINSRKEDARPPIEEVVVKLAVKHVWKYLNTLTIFGFLAKGKAMLPVLRALGFLMCKQPAKHRAVIEYCVDPLSNNLMSTTKKNLLLAFQYWLPSMRTDI